MIDITPHALLEKELENLNDLEERAITVLRFGRSLVEYQQGLLAEIKLQRTQAEFEFFEHKARHNKRIDLPEL